MIPLISLVSLINTFCIATVLSRIRDYPKELPTRISKNFILEGIKFILENNYFCFNDTYFVQIKGTAMGTKFAPVYATLVLAYLEEKLYVQLENEFDWEFRQYIGDNFKRSWMIVSFTS